MVQRRRKTAVEEIEVMCVLCNRFLVCTNNTSTYWRESRQFIRKRVWSYIINIFNEWEMNRSAERQIHDQPVTYTPYALALNIHGRKVDRYLDTCNEEKRERQLFCAPGLFISWIEYGHNPGRSSHFTWASAKEVSVLYKIAEEMVYTVSHPF